MRGVSVRGYSLLPPNAIPGQTQFPITPGGVSQTLGVITSREIGWKGWNDNSSGEITYHTHPRVPQDCRQLSRKEWLGSSAIEETARFLPWVCTNPAGCQYGGSDDSALHWGMMRHVAKAKWMWVGAWGRVGEGWRRIVAISPFLRLDLSMKRHAILHMQVCLDASTCHTEGVVKCPCGWQVSYCTRCLPWSTELEYLSWGGLRKVDPVIP